MDGSKFNEAEILLAKIQSNYEERKKNLDDNLNLQNLIFFYKSPSERKNNERFLMPDGKYNQIDTSEFVSDFLPTYSVNMNTFDEFPDNIKLWDSDKIQYIEQKPLKHQKYVLQYLNNNTPFRGLLYYHGLGSGKTGASIMTAAGFTKQTIIMTPASLQSNFRGEILDKFGHNYLKKYNHWKWVPLDIEIPDNDTFSNIAIKNEMARVLLNLKKKKKEKAQKINRPTLIRIKLFADENFDIKEEADIDTLIEKLDSLNTNFETTINHINTYMKQIKTILPIIKRKSNNSIGVWVIDEGENENYNELSETERGEVNIQIKNY